MRRMKETPIAENPPLGRASDTPSLGILLGTVRAEMVRAIETELASQGVDLSFTQFLILKKAQQLGPASATELARAVELDGGAMTRQLDQLERKGFLARTPDAQDRRALRIALTAAGKKVWRNTASVCHQHVMSAAQSSLDSTEQAQLYDYLSRVLHALRDKS
ncbi:MAG: MarR family transcriptional regulator [Rhodanobacter sp.]|nr:MAG: MarR family transcriptional regulator [Rhodanobacter sp.]TAN28004.1 MAG: MarR family transcriptional regulator [Rhodanobacter sp.]